MCAQILGTKRRFESALGAVLRAHSLCLWPWSPATEKKPLGKVQGLSVTHSLLAGGRSRMFPPPSEKKRESRRWKHAEKADWVTRSPCSARAYLTGRRPADVRLRGGTRPVKRAVSKQRVNSLHTKQSKESICPEPEEGDCKARIKPAAATAKWTRPAFHLQNKHQNRNHHHDASIFISVWALLLWINRSRHVNVWIQKQKIRAAGVLVLNPSGFTLNLFPLLFTETKSHCA